jgi:energy-converting hydrogenase A subunit M
MDFQGVFNENAELMDPMNRPYGALKGEAFIVVLRDIAKRAATQLKMDPEEIVQIVMDAKKKSQDEIIDQ